MPLFIAVFGMLRPRQSIGLNTIMHNV